MQAELKPGLAGEARLVVNADHLASRYGSGTIDVFATPAMVALMENAAHQAVAAALPVGAVTVGTRIDVRHVAATPPGLEVVARADLVDVDGRRLVFRVVASDPVETIGEGVHERAIVDPDRLLTRARAKVPAGS